MSSNAAGSNAAVPMARGRLSTTSLAELLVLALLAQELVDTLGKDNVEVYSKAAIVGLTKGLARDLGPLGITVNNIQPGPIDTEMLHSAMPDPEVLRRRMERVPLGRMGTIDDVVRLVLYLASHGFDRAIMLIPTWFLLVLWVATAGFAVAGWITNDLVSPALVGGLVLIVMLIGFTVMQNAFAGGIAHGSVSDSERRALALTGAGAYSIDAFLSV